MRRRMRLCYRSGDCTIHYHQKITERSETKAQACMLSYLGHESLHSDVNVLGRRGRFFRKTLGQQLRETNHFRRESISRPQGSIL